MINKLKILLSFLILAGGMTSCSTCHSSQQNASESLTQYVNPLIGSAHCRWFHVAPGALPFGLAKPGPATNASLGNKSGWEATGYDYRDASIEGFPCLHEFQIGGIVLMPTTGNLITIPGPVDSQLDSKNLSNSDSKDSSEETPKSTSKFKGYRSSFDHADEIARPGYYSVFLKDYNIKAEVTATKRVAYQRFTFPKAEQSHVLFNIGNRQGESGPAVNSEVNVTPDGLVEGWVETLPAYCNKYQKGATIKMFFSAVMNKKPDQIGVYRNDEIFEGKSQVNGVGSGAYLTYKTDDNESVTAKVGLSYTSVENARLNRDIETHNGDLSFDDAQRKANQTWENYLGRIRVETASKEDKVKFYTGLYHAVLGRGLASDINGAYPKHDGTVGQIPKENGEPIFSFYNSDAMWGAQWELVQLWALAYPEYLSDYVSTHVQVYKDSGWMGDGLANSRYVSGVGTNQLGNVIAAAYLCGIRDFDVESAYAAARKNELDGDNRPLGAGKVDVNKFLKYGYVPHLDEGPWPDESWMFSASHTLEYSFGAYAVAQMAKDLGKEDDYERLMQLSKGWEKLYDSELNLIHPRWDNGKFIDDFDPMQVWRGFQEGNAYQYTFYVPHDPKGLIDKMGAEKFTARLDSIFTWSQDKIFSGGKTIGAFAGLKTYYNHGNQPCLHISWLFNEAGRPSLTQKWVHAILDEFYGTDGIHGYGYGQDEDQGQLGAWYALSSLGLFDVAGLANVNPEFSLGSPKFDKVTITLNPNYYTGKEFIIETRNNAPAKNNSSANKNEQRNIYAQRYILNGETVTDLSLPFSVVTSGGKLIVEMGNSPKDKY